MRKIKTPKSLAEACHQSVKRSEDGATAVAGRLDVPYARLMCELNDANTTHKLAANMVLSIMRATGDDLPLQYLAREMGGVFVRLPRSEGLHMALRECVEATSTFGSLVRVYEEATSPDSPSGERISDDELAEFLRTAGQCQEKILAFVEAVRVEQRQRDV